MLELDRKNNEAKPLTYDEALKHYFGNWLWRAIYAFLDHQDFDGSPLWLSQKLDVKVEDVVTALDGLIQLNLAKRSERGFESRCQQFLIPDEHNSMQARMNQHKNLSRQVLNHLDPGKQAFFRSSFVAAEWKQVVEFYEGVRACLARLREQASQSKQKEGVYGITIEGVNLDQSEPGKGGCQ